MIAAIAAKWVFTYFIFMTGPGVDPGEPTPCVLPTCSVFTTVDTSDECDDLLKLARGKGAEVQIVAACIEVGAGATTVSRALSTDERRRLELERAIRKDGAKS